MSNKSPTDPFENLWIATSNTTRVKVTVPPKRKTLENKYIGRRILPEVYKEVYGVNGWYLETEDYDEAGITCCMKPEVDEDGYISHLKLWKVQETSPGPRPVSHDVRLTREDRAAFEKQLESTLQPATDCRVTTVASLLPGYTLEKLKTDYASLLKAIDAQNLAKVKELAPAVRVILPDVHEGNGTALSSALRRHNPELLKLLLDAGVYLLGELKYDAEWCLSVLGEEDDWEGFKVMWRVYNPSPDPNYSPYLPHGMEITYERAQELFRINPKGRFAWSDKLFYEYCEKDRSALIRLIKARKVELPLDLYIQRGDLELFKVRLASEILEDEGYLARRACERGGEWLKAVIDAANQSEESPQIIVDYLDDLFRAEKYAAWLKVVDQLKYPLPDDAYFAFDIHTLEGREHDPEAIRLVETAFARHRRVKGACWPSDFKSCFLHFASEKAIFDAILERPEFLGTEAPDGLGFCAEIAHNRTDGVFKVALKAYLAIPTRIRSDDTPDNRRAKLRRFLERDLSSFQKLVANPPDYYSKAELADYRRQIANLEHALKEL